MCDTIAVVRPEGVLFAKNSDRDPNEGQNLEWHARRTHPSGATLRCTHIEIPETEETHATLLSRPFWIWGAEIGTNEHGLTIGNESVFTKEPNERPGLIGMDLLRLALERADTAKAACEVIARLLETYGQGGGCGFENRRFAYHNSFIVADPTTAYVFETAGREWAAEEIVGTRSISNGLTIPEFNRRHSDFIKTKASGCRIRQARTQSLADRARGVADLMEILRDHGNNHTEPAYSWFNSGLHAPCVHGGGIVVSSQTTASWVADLRPGASAHWVTATAAPCTGLFKPVRIDEALDLGPPARDKAGGSLWWRHERFHRAVMRNPAELRPLFAAERDAVQATWIENPPEGRSAFEEAGGLLADWTKRIESHPAEDLRPWWVRRYWAKRNRWAGVYYE